MMPIVHGLEQRYDGQIEFVYLDTDDPAVAPFMEEMEMIARPHFYLLDAQGNIVDQWLGPIKEEQFVRVFDELLETASK
jgi:thioredoxin-like negative regulator of GroEL